ncbi:MAG: glycosyltransferase family 39 protein [candidate division Zixibacteria bacterium]|nr:glycosyltransferase family 39 protein [candidate division Zixibacteria bacterium]
MNLDKTFGRLGRYQTWLVPLALFIAAITMRLIFLNQIQEFPTFDHPIMDEGYHVQVVDQINSDTLPKEPFYRAPLYPYLLALFMQIAGGSLYWVRFIQIVLGSFLPLLVYGLGVRLFSRNIAFWATSLAVFYPTFLYYDVTLLITSLMVLLTALFVYQLYRCQSDPERLSLFVVAGLLLGLAGLARPNILLAGPVLAFWVWLILKPELGWRKALIRYALIGFASLIVILPITIRNYVVSDDPVFIAWQGGFNFYLGNNSEATGWSATVSDIDPTWQGGYRDAVAVAEHRLGGTLKKSEVSDFWYDLAWEEIVAHPGHFLTLQIKKARLFVNGYEIPNNQDIYFTRDFAPILRPLLSNGFVYWPFGLLMPLAILGFFFSLRRWRKFLALYLVSGAWILSLQMFFVCARYRQPLIPLILLFAVYAAVRIIELARRRDKRNLLLVCIAGVLLLWESNHDILHLSPQRVEAENRHMLGNAFNDQNNPIRAEKEFRKAIAADSTFAPGFNNLGMMLAQRGSWLEAADLFRHGITIDPQTVETFFNLATAYLELGDNEAAIDVLLRARQLHPFHDYVHLKLGMTYYEIGQLPQALEAVEQSLRINPSNETARQFYQQIQQAIEQ